MVNPYCGILRGNRKEWIIDTLNNSDGPQGNDAGGMWVWLQRDSKREPSSDEKVLYFDYGTGYANPYMC